MTLDSCFVRELKKQANGDGGREDRFRFLRVAREACRELSTYRVRAVFPEVMKKYGRIPVAVCVAATVVARADCLMWPTVQWGREVLALWTNHGPMSVDSVYIDDNIHPTAIEEYAKGLIRATIEEL